MIIALHQPNFFPWYPYFHRMEQADRFVIVKQCQFANYLFQKRFHINSMWYSMPISNRKKLEPILNKEYVNCEKSWKALKRRLPEYAHILKLFDDDIGGSLVDTNVRIILRIRDILGIKTEMVYDYPTLLVSTERVVDLLKYYAGHVFLAGPSWDNYMNKTLFDNAGIHIEPHRIDEDLKIPILPVLQKVLYSESPGLLYGSRNS